MLKYGQWQKEKWGRQSWGFLRCKYSWREYERSVNGKGYKVLFQLPTAHYTRQLSRPHWGYFQLNHFLLAAVWFLMVRRNFCDCICTYLQNARNTSCMYFCDHLYSFNCCYFLSLPERSTSFGWTFISVNRRRQTCVCCFFFLFFVVQACADKKLEATLIWNGY